VAAELNKTLAKMLSPVENAQAAEKADICVLTVVQEAHQSAVQSQNLRCKVKFW
jgi:predicted dinucleotide-binding enzyme